METRQEKQCRLRMHRLRCSLAIAWRMALSKIFQWFNQDRRKRQAYSFGTIKYAVRRDGPLYLVECPNCHDQDIYYNKDQNAFFCCECKTWFQVYLEDGLYKIIDRRRGNVRLPKTDCDWWPLREVRAVQEPGAECLQLGLDKDAPWWWTRAPIYRDLQSDGRDGHGHEFYRKIPKPELRASEDGVCEAAQGVRAFENAIPQE